MRDVRADPQVSAGSTPFQGEGGASGPSRERMDGPAALTFAQLRETNVARCSRWHPGFPNDGQWTGEDWANATAGEMGEACNVVKKLRRQETRLRGAVDPDYDVLRTKRGDEIADTLIYLDLLEAFYGITPRGGSYADIGSSSVDGMVKRNGAGWSNSVAAAMGAVCETVEWITSDYPITVSRQDHLRPYTRLLMVRLCHLAHFYGVDVSAAIVRKFNAISEREGLPERLS